MRLGVEARELEDVDSSKGAEEGERIAARLCGGGIVELGGPFGPGVVGGG